MTRVSHWNLKTRSLALDRIPRLMGILNVTPDSFSDGGKFLSTDSAMRQVESLVAQGADIVDVGGESTRPYADAIETQQELDRVMPIVERITTGIDVIVSIDTSKAEVARSAVAAGAEIVNDVTGLEGDPAMVDVVRDSEAGVCVMHIQGTPQTMQDQPHYDNVVQEVWSYLQQRRQALVDVGIHPERICLDPGIGFGKEHHHNVQLLSAAERFLELPAPILIGHSRKGFIGKLLGDKERSRDAATAGISVAMAVKGIHLLRVHDVASSRDAMLFFHHVSPFGDP